MGQLGRPLAAAALVAYWALWILASERVFGEPGALRDFIHNDAFFVYGVVGAVLVGLYVGRWWVLILAGTPIAVWAGLQAVGHVAPFEGSEPPLNHFFWQAEGWLFVLWLYVTPLAVGVVVQKGLSLRARRTAPVA